ncbi:MAG: 1-acyl-sn-glycerol-3-phosphate acyltransferase [Myxococcales bacterium]|nr:1-acyl-sn-glycerol-3-phosphate acyltransferase [Myxococcales bacterium]
MNYARAAWNWGQVAGEAMIYGGIALTVGMVPKARRLRSWCMHRWCAGSADRIKLRRHLYNGELLDEVPQAILVANHLSSLDILLIGSYLRRDFRWLAKAALFKVPISGWFLSTAGHIRVHRGDQAHSRNKSIREQVHQVVGEGASVLYFPEGTRSRTGELTEFRMGAFLAAVREGLPILPLVVRGTNEVMEAGAKDLSVKPDRSCSLTVLPPISLDAIGASGDEGDRAARLRDLTWQLIADELNRDATNATAAAS